MDLLTENTWIGDELTLLQENMGADKRMYINGPFIVMDKKNGNDRIYGSDNTVPAVNTYINDWVTPNRAMGELNHPGLPRVNPERACIKIEKLTLNEADSVYMGKAKVLRTPLGLILQTLIEDDIRFGVSSRMRGTVDKFTNRVNNDLVIVTASDVVTDPSASEAMVESLMEHREIFSDQSDSANMLYEEFRNSLHTKGRNPVDEILFDFIRNVKAHL